MMYKVHYLVNFLDTESEIVPATGIVMSHT